MDKIFIHALKAEAKYEFTDLDSGKATKSTGQELMENGLHLEAASPRTALILTFKEVQ